LVSFVALTFVCVSQYQILASYGRMFAPVAKQTLSERFVSWFSRGDKKAVKGKDADKPKEAKADAVAGVVLNDGECTGTFGNRALCRAI
jgi:hypothetical protein